MKVIKLFFLFLFLNLDINAQTGSDTLTALKIINKSIDAMGGKEYLKSIKWKEDRCIGS
jgi:hypothetical protein